MFGPANVLTLGDFGTLLVVDTLDGLLDQVVTPEYMRIDQDRGGIEVDQNWHALLPGGGPGRLASYMRAKSEEDSREE